MTAHDQRCPLGFGQPDDLRTQLGAIDGDMDQQHPKRLVPTGDIDREHVGNVRDPRIDVAAHRVEWGELTELVENGKVSNVPAVQNRVGLERREVVADRGVRLRVSVGYRDEPSRPIRAQPDRGRLLVEAANQEPYSLIVTLIIFTGVFGRSPAPVGVVSIFFTTSMPEVTFANTGCFEAPGVNQSR